MTGAAMKGTTGPTASGGRNSGRPSDLTWPSRSGSRSGSRALPRYSNSPIPPGSSQSSRASSAVIPEERKSAIRPESSRRVITP